MIHISEQKQILATIAALASTPTERLQGNWACDASPLSLSESLTRLQRLYTVVGVTDEETKVRFLTHLQLREEQLLSVLSVPIPTENTRLPAWINTLEHILSESAIHSLRREPIPRDRCFLQDNPRPFEEFFLPFICYARKHLLSLLPTQLQIVSEGAMSGLENQLLRLLAYHTGYVLEDAFSHFRAGRGITPPYSAESGKERFLYEAFLRQYQGEGLLTFFAEHSVLARLLIQLVEQWIEVNVEFFQRLEADSDQIIQYFQWSQAPGPIVRLQSDCSDSHHHGRTVFLLFFADGHKLVYKPRNMDIDHAFFACITWLNGHGLSPDLKCARSLSKGTYGWMEYVEQLPCTSYEEVQSYYQRAGQLVCLLYLLGTVDVHSENLIACGAYPLLIDLETIMSAGGLWLSAQRDETDQLPHNHSIVMSGILPRKREQVRNDMEASISGLTSRTDYLSPHPYRTWKDINTDAVTLSYEYQRVALDQETNRVLLDGSSMPLSDFLVELITGFRVMYRFLLAHRSSLLASDGPLSAFHGCPIRFVLRPTEVYAKHLSRLVHPQFTHNGSDRWIETQAFKRLLLKSVCDARLWTITEEELNALERIDVPWFGTRTESKDLFLITGEPVVENIFARSAFEQMRLCLKSFSDEDLEHQVNLLRDVLEAKQEELKSTALVQA